MNYSLVQQSSTALVDLHIATYSGTDQERLAICLESLKDLDVNVWVIYNDTGILFPARKFGFNLGTCPYVSYVDDDDYVDNDRLRMMLLWLSLELPDATFTNSCKVVDGIAIQIHDSSLSYDYLTEEVKGPWPHQLIVVKRSVVQMALDRIQENPMFAGLLDNACDYAWHREISLARLWTYYPKVVYFWVRRPDSLSSKIGIPHPIIEYYRKKRIAYVQSIPKP